MAGVLVEAAGNNAIRGHIDGDVVKTAARLAWTTNGDPSKAFDAALRIAVEESKRESEALEAQRSAIQTEEVTA